MINLFRELSENCSKSATEKYSTSFSSAIRLLHNDLRQPIYNIYGFVRFADEIVDSFHDYNKIELLSEFKRDTYQAIERGISLNPILHSFQLTVNAYNIDHNLIEAFFHSMELDLDKTTYNPDGYKEYIYGSAEVVGLMCLYIFCEGNRELFKELKPGAQALGAAFQKVNFLRDVKADFNQLNRSYFPGVDFNNFTEEMKKEIEDDIALDFKNAYAGLLKLPAKSRFGVFVAYKYYLSLFKKIKRKTSNTILEERVRIPNFGKAVIVAKAGVRNQFNIY